MQLIKSDYEWLVLFSVHGSLQLCAKRLISLKNYIQPNTISLLNISVTNLHSYMVIPTIIRPHCSTTHIDASMCVVLQCSLITVGITMQLECGPMPNVMAALPNIGGALCSMPQSLADTHYLTAVQ